MEGRDKINISKPRKMPPAGRTANCEPSGGGFSCDQIKEKIAIMPK